MPGAWNFQSHQSSREGWKFESTKDHTFKMKPLCKVKILCTGLEVSLAWGLLASHALGPGAPVPTGTETCVGGGALDLTSSVGYIYM